MGAETGGAAQRKLTRNAKKRQRKKQQKQEQRAVEEVSSSIADAGSAPSAKGTKAADAASQAKANTSQNITDVDYVPEKLDLNQLTGELAALEGVFKRFAEVEQAAANGKENVDLLKQKRNESKNATENSLRLSKSSEREIRDETALDNSDEEEELDEEDEKSPREKHLSKAQRKKLARFTVAELKQVVPRPDLVEAHDVASPDPVLLLNLKANSNSVAVPRHWSALRKFLQGKRGLERVAYKLPDFIAETGINKIRAELAEKEAEKKARQIARDRVAPKMGVMDIDFQVLHDAFFKYQTKPTLKAHGEIYYEGMEHQLDTGKFKPGALSSALRKALGMKENSPPPWLLNMQRHGPPPSYPELDVPGVNAPLPAGARFGFHEGGWGKAPVDQFGRPLFGDGVLASTNDDEKSSGNNAEANEAPGAVEHWGVLQSDEEDESEESEDEPDLDSDAESEKSGAAGDDAASDVSQDQKQTNEVTSTEVNSQTRKRQRSESLGEDEQAHRTLKVQKENQDHDKSLFTVIAQKQATVGDETFATSYKYDLSSGSSNQHGPNNATRDLENSESKDIHRKTRDTNQSTSKTIGDGENDDEADHLEQNFKF